MMAGNNFLATGNNPEKEVVPSKSLDAVEEKQPLATWQQLHTPVTCTYTHIHAQNHADTRLGKVSANVLAREERCHCCQDGADEPEKEVEAYLVKGCKKRGWLCLKFTSPGNAGVPDRMVLLPGGRIAFVELKHPKGGRVAKIQKYQAERFAKLGHRVYLIRNRRQADAFFGEALL